MTTETAGRSRRALLGAGIGAVAASVVSAIGRPTATRATDRAVVLGGYNEHSGRTWLKSTNDDAIVGESVTSARSGLYALNHHAGGFGVWATNAATGTIGTLGDPAAGMIGYGGTLPGVKGFSTSSDGVWGESQDPFQSGVHGRHSTGASGSLGTGNAGVYGQGATGVLGSSFTGSGVQGDTRTGSGVKGVYDRGQSEGRLGTSEAGVRGIGVHAAGVVGTSGPGAPTTPAHVGVYGYAGVVSDSRGVVGETTGGRGVEGIATTGVAGRFSAASQGTALEATGRLKLSTSGVATIPAGSTSITVSPGVDVTAESFVLLTPKTNLAGRGVWFTTNPTGDTFTIRISTSRSQVTRIAWLLLG